MRTCHLFLLSLFLASVGIIGSAHDDFFKFDHSLRHLFPYDGKALPNLKELDDVSALPTMFHFASKQHVNTLYDLCS
jgi:hypothetical protein